MGVCTYTMTPNGGRVGGYGKFYCLSFKGSRRVCFACSLLVCFRRGARCVTRLSIFFYAPKNARSDHENHGVVGL
jgi:hypothetical protein